jgi:glycosyltransferase involved in cell wall biosynthesis
MYRGKRISVVIPCHNEEDGIAAVMAQMPPIIDEVVVVDNNSTDRTAEVATAAGARGDRDPQGLRYAHKAATQRPRATSSSRWTVMVPIRPTASRSSCT